MVEQILVNYLRRKGWFVEQPEHMKFQEIEVADALGRLRNYTWFESFEPFSEVQIVTIEMKRDL